MIDKTPTQQAETSRVECGTCHYFTRLKSVAAACDLDGGLCNLHGHNVDELCECEDWAKEQMVSDRLHAEAAE